MEVIKLAEVTRGTLVENVHRGVYAVVDSAGQIIARGGDVNYISYLRSAAKPIQALPVVESGAADHLALTEEELAIITASHSGEEAHRSTVASLLRKIGVGVEALHCGTHTPFHRTTATQLLLNGMKPDVLHCSCSGKHSGMLALCRYKGWSFDSYYAPEHPVQRLMLSYISQITEEPEDKIVIGIDGCGVPVFGVPVYRMAYAYARLASPLSFSPERQTACRRVSGAMMKYPVLVAGTNRFCTDLMIAAEGRIMAKDGTDGVFCLGIPDKGWGIAVKVEDGSMRVLEPVIVSILEQLSILEPGQLARLEKYSRPEIKNYRQEIIGQMRSLLSIKGS